MNCNVEITAVGTADGLEVSIHGGSVGMMTAAELMRLRNQMRQGMDALWKQNVPPASIDTTMKEAYRAETVWLTIRYALAWHDFPEGGQWVDFYEPMNRSDQPMPKVELKLKGEEK